jgi:hypothetical protein
MYKFKNKELILSSISISQEIRKDNTLLTNKDITIFNSSLIPIKGSTNFLIASRGWYGNVRSWDGINFIVLTIFNKNYKKIKQNIIDVDLNLLEEHNLKFKEFKNRIVVHQKQSLEGPEDPRLFYYKDDIFILVNEINDDRKRLMYLAVIDIDTLNYKIPKTLVCESLSSNFEKNWGPFTYKNKLHMLYDINPLKIFEVDGQYSCKMIVNKFDKKISEMVKSFGNLHFHMRNSSNLIKFGTEYLGIGHAVLDYKYSTDINKFLIPALADSDYSGSDKDYFNRFFKYYLGFFYTLDMNKQEITKISPFFQLPSKESKQELIFFPTSFYEDKNNFLNISYSLGDNRSYVCKLHKEVVKASLYNKENIDVHMNFDINPNYYLELLRTLRIMNKLPHSLKDYIIFFGTKNRKNMKKSVMKQSKYMSKSNSIGSKSSYKSSYKSGYKSKSKSSKRRR